VVGGMAFQFFYCQCFVQLDAVTFCLAEVNTDIAKNCWKGDLLTNDGYCFSVFAFADQSDVAWDIYPGRAGVLTWGFNQRTTYPCLTVVFLDVFFIFVAEITNRGQDWI
jgi:hypothetical protein